VERIKVLNNIVGILSFTLAITVWELPLNNKDFFFLICMIFIVIAEISIMPKVKYNFKEI